MKVILVVLAMICEVFGRCLCIVGDIFMKAAIGLLTMVTKKEVIEVVDQA